MGRTSVVARRFGTIGLAAVVVGAVLVGGAVAASAGSGTPTITVAGIPSGGLSVDPTMPSPVQLTGKGFPTGSPSGGGFSECSTAAGQPTVAVTGIGAMPVSCSDPFTAGDNVNKAGQTPARRDGGHRRHHRSSRSGTDTSGGDAVSDAVNYPCPPYASQVSAGGDLRDHVRRRRRRFGHVSDQFHK